MGNTFSNLNCHRIDNNKNYILYTILKAHLIFYPTNFLFYHIFIPAKTTKKTSKEENGKKKRKWKKKKKSQFEHCHIPSGISSHGIENTWKILISWFILHGLRLCYTQKTYLFDIPINTRIEKSRPHIYMCIKSPSITILFKGGKFII